MGENPTVEYGIPLGFALLVLIIVSVALRKESFVLRAVISSICGVATWILLFLVGQQVINGG
jgi:hypothetical protein